MKIVLLSLSFIVSIITGAKCDTLTINGKKVILDRPSPLEQYPGISKLHYLLREYGSEAFDDGCTGYEADWVIINNLLYLKSIRSCALSSKKLVARLDTMFPGVSENEMVAANWVNADLWSPSGKAVHWSDRLQSFTYNHETRYTIKAGKLVSTKEFDYPTSKESELGADPSAITSFIYKNIRWAELPKGDSPAQRVFISVKTGRTERADSVIIIDELPMMFIITKLYG